MLKVLYIRAEWDAEVAVWGSDWKERPEHQHDHAAADDAKHPLDRLEFSLEFNQLAPDTLDV